MWPINQLHGVEFSKCDLDHWSGRGEDQVLAKCMQTVKACGEADLASCAAFYLSWVLDAQVCIGWAA